MNTKRGSIAFVFILALALAATAGAYVLKSWRWPSAQATFNTSQLPTSAWRSLARNAADEWEDTGEFNWTHSSSSQNKLEVSYLDGSGNKLATTTHQKHGNFLYKIGIVFDSSEPWHTSSGTPPSSKYDALSVAVHEFGHAVGIDHPQSSKCSSSVPKSRRPTMCQHDDGGDAKKNDTYRRSLEGDDEDAIEDQYDMTSSGIGLEIGNGVNVCVDFESVGLSREDRARESQAVIHGLVTSVGPTRWNADDGQYWDDPTSSSAVLPYHIVTLEPFEVLSDEGVGLTGSTSVSILIARMSPIDSSGCGPGSVSPFAVGNEIIAFVENREIAWRTKGFYRTLQFTGEPAESSLIKMKTGDFQEMHSLEIDEPQYSVDELRRVIRDLRDSE